MDTLCFVFLYAGLRFRALPSQYASRLRHGCHESAFKQKRTFLHTGSCHFNVGVCFVSSLFSMDGRDKICGGQPGCTYHSDAGNTDYAAYRHFSNDKANVVYCRSNFASPSFGWDCHMESIVCTTPCQTQSYRCYKHTKRPFFHYQNK